MYESEQKMYGGGQWEVKFYVVSFDPNRYKDYFTGCWFS